MQPLGIPLPSVREFLGISELVEYVTFSVLSGDYSVACKAAGNWCSVSKSNHATCTADFWNELSRRVFQNAGRILVEAQPNFYAQCNRAKAYTNGDIQLINYPSDFGIRAYALAAVRHDPYNLSMISDELKGDRLIVLAALGHKLAIRHSPLAAAADWCKSDLDIVMAAVSQEGTALKWVQGPLASNRIVSLVSVTNNGKALEFVAKDLHQHYEILEEAVKQNGFAIQWVSTNDMAAYFKLALLAVKQNGLALEMVQPNMHGDEFAWEDLVIAAVEQEAYALFHVAQFQTNRAVVMAAVKKDGDTLQFAAKYLRDDREIVKIAVNNSGIALQWGRLYNTDRSIVLDAVRNNGEALIYADQMFKRDRRIVLEAVSQNGEMLEYVDELFKSDDEIVMAAVVECGSALQYADDVLKGDYEIVMAAVSQDGWSLNYADKLLTMNREIVLAAVSRSGYALQFADDSLKKNYEIVMAAITQNEQMAQYAISGWDEDNEEGYAAEMRDTNLELMQSIVH